MSRGDGEHSFGHGQYCYWCGVDGDDPEIEKPCDERERQKPDVETEAHFDAREDLGVQIEDLGGVNFTYSETTLEEVAAKVLALKPRRGKLRVQEQK